LAVGILLLEIAVRAFGLDTALVWRPHPVLGWWHVPGAEQHWTSEGDGWIHINSRGARDIERSQQKASGVLRVAIFGDSMTEGVQVNLPQTFSQLLETQLTTALGQRVEVLNFGVNGYSPLQEYLLYKNYGAEYAPDIVLHAVFLDTDVADLYPKIATGQRDAPVVTGSRGTGLVVNYGPAEQSVREYDREPIASFRRLSAIYRLLSTWRTRRISADTFQAGQAESHGIPRRYVLYSANAPADWDDAWDRLERVIVAFDCEVRQHGAKYIVLSVPAGQIVNPEAWSDLLRVYPAMKNEPWQLGVPEMRLAKITGQHSIPFMSVVDRFAAQPDRTQLFFGRAGHFTPRGHAVMADLLKERLLHELAQRTHGTQTD
jgi:hypothetical protein